MKAFFCLTPVHVFRTISLMLGKWKNEKADIYIFDSFADSRRISEKIKKTEIFKHVYWLNRREYSAESSIDVIIRLVRKGDLRKLLLKNKYNEIYFFNSTWVLNTLAYTLCYRRNNKVQLNYVEDGPGLYNFYEWDWNLKMKLMFPLLGMRNPAKFIEKYWFTEPKLIRYKGKAEKEKLPAIDRTNKKLVETVNFIFDYQPYNFSEVDVMIMEESFYNDKFLSDNSDFLLFKKIIERYSNKNFLIKLHPRTEKNRFTEGCKLFKQQGVPWELIALNADTSNLIMLSLSCTTMMSAKLLYGDEPQVIYLYPMFEKKVITTKGKKYFDDNSLYYLNESVQMYRDLNRIHVVQTEKELFALLENLFK